MSINANFCYPITLYHLTATEAGDSWSRGVIQNCSVVSQVRETVTDENKMSIARSVTVRIPEPVAISEGDIIVLAEVTDEMTNAPALLRKYKDTSFQVRGIANNMRYFPPHIKVVS